MRAWREDPKPRLAGFRPTALLVDGAYVARAERVLGRAIDWAGLIRRLGAEGGLRSIHLYAPVRSTSGPNRPPGGLAALTEAALPFGVRLVIHLEPVAGDGHGRRLPVGLAMELAIDAVEQVPHLDDLVVIAGDAMVRRVIDWVQRKGVRVTIVAGKRHGLVADRLRRQCDVFVDLGAVAVPIECQPFRLTRPEPSRPANRVMGGSR